MKKISRYAHEEDDSGAHLTVYTPSGIRREDTYEISHILFGVDHQQLLTRYSGALVC